MTLIYKLQLFYILIKIRVFRLINVNLMIPMTTNILLMQIFLKKFEFWYKKYFFFYIIEHLVKNSYLFNIYSICY